ncbi:MAG TPA: dockerin type I domain-containing protein, partial [Bacteroidota bacterium]
MVANIIKRKTHLVRWTGPSCRHVRLWLAVATMVTLSDGLNGQNLINHGKITNTGTLRVKNQAVGITDSLNGVFELFGVNQAVPATQFANLSLTGSGNYSAGGNVAVNNVLTIVPAVSLQVAPGFSITLGSSTGQLIENGYLSGTVRKSVDLNGPSPDTAFGGIGVSISWNGVNPGVTSATRTTGSTITVGSKQSIQRYFDVLPTIASNLNGTLRFTYANSELAGADPSTLELWRSPDNGATWRRERVNRTGNTLTKNGIRSFGRWTAADANNLLGLAQYEWEADTMRILAGNSQTGRVKQLLDTAFVATVSDVYGQPVQGQTVTFSVTQTPLNSVGDSLTVISAVSDSTGRVRSVLKLGSLKGDYYVQASVAGTPSAIATFHAVARSAASILNVVSPAIASDSVKSQIGPLTVKATDSTGTGVQGIQINFAVSSAPDTAGSYQLSNITSSTDTSGLAFTSLRMGSKSGKYIITATSPDVDPPVTRQIVVNALPGTIANVNFTGGGNDSVTALKRLSVQVLDSYRNPRSGDTVQFAISVKPAGSTIDSLFVTSAITDSVGNAATTFRVGQKSGSYAVSAVLKNHPQFGNLFTINAHNLAPSIMIAGTPSLSDTIGAVMQPLRVTVSDKFNNPVGGANVTFAVAQRPDSTAGGSVSTNTVSTDSTLGQASTVFTAGDKVGVYVIHAATGAFVQDFTMHVTQGRPAQMLAKGVNQSKTIMQQADSSFTVILTDRKANPWPNLPVHFSIIQKPAGTVGDSLLQTSTSTDQLGATSARLKLGNKVGLYVVSATSDSLAGVTRIFTVNALNSIAVALDSVRGEYQRKPILSVLDTAFVVTVTDQGGNPVPGVIVNFLVTGKPPGAAGDSLTSTVDTTGGTGEAITYLRLGTKVGSYIVTASSPTLPTITRRFIANASNGAAVAVVKIAGDRQFAIPNRQLDSSFVVNVHDLGNNPVPGATVRFAISQIPTPATIGQTLSDSIAVTDSLGRASTRLTIGSDVGAYVVSAAVNGIPAVTFNTTSFLLTGDANVDGAVNIADLTSVIDHILGKHLLTGSDSAAADANNDGVIDIRDVILVRSRILTGNWSQRVPDSLFALSRPPLRELPGDVASDTGASAVVALSSSLEATENGMRLNLSSNQPVKGLQYIIRMKNPPMIQKPDVVYERSAMMTILVFRTDSTLRIVAYNLDNTPIQPGDGPIFRLPIAASKIADVDTAQCQLIVSEG